MSQEKRRIGDNHNPIQDQAIKLVDALYDRLLQIDKYLGQAIGGKNKTVRDNNAFIAAVHSAKTLKELKSWNEIIKAKNNGADIHCAPLKHHKLEIVGGWYNEFGQYIVDKKEVADDKR